jgi:serine/threonine protein kinase
VAGDKNVAMRIIRLAGGEWLIDESKPLGKPGGFGTVFAGTSSQSEPVAIKKLHLSAVEAAHREMDISTYLVGKKFDYVIPTLDSGQDAESEEYFVVMGMAEKSLRDELKSRQDFTNQETLSILTQITSGLLEVSEIVHRDLKPENVLFHSGNWKIADFGVAKFYEDSTSARTVRGFLSLPYAAPEQWRLEKPVPETDVYALGCIAYELLNGAPPFLGPSEGEYQEQHLHAVPKVLSNVLPQMATFVSMLLRKNSSSRPSKKRVLGVLTQISSQQRMEPSKGFANLAEVALAISEEEALAEAEKQKTISEQSRREQLAISANQIFHKLFDDFYDTLLEFAPNLKRVSAPDSMQKHFRLGSAELIVVMLNDGKLMDKSEFSQSGWDVILGGSIHVIQKLNMDYFCEANLWYTDMGLKEGYRWWEISYMGDRSYRRHDFQPFAVSSLSYADNAAAPTGVKDIQFATKPSPIDDEDLDSFCERWADILAKASKGELRTPGVLPIN